MSGSNPDGANVLLRGARQPRGCKGLAIPTLLVFAAGCGGAVGCGGPSTDSGSEGVWGDASVVEELAIGVEFGADEYMFGRIYSLAVGPDGTIHVTDSQGPVVRSYDGDGNFLRNVGRQGQGPGEYNRAPALRVLSDGRLAMWDFSASRISLFSREGEYQRSLVVGTGFGGQRSFFVDTDDNFYIKDVRPEARSESDAWFRRYSPEGEELGRVEPPRAGPLGRGFVLFAEGVSAFEAQRVTTFSPLGYAVTGLNDAYGIELLEPDGRAYLMRDVPRVSLAREERAEWEAFRQTIVTREAARGRPGPDPLPHAKPYFRDILVGDDGRIWVFRYVEAVKRHDIEPLPDRPDRPLLTWREPWTYDVFEPDGAFLGSVVVPELFQPFVARGELLWGSHLDDEGVGRVLRLRVVPGRG